MFTIVIGDGLTNEFLSPEVQFQTCPLNVGRQEIDRLLGAGPDFGSGVLPRFLREIASAGKKLGFHGPAAVYALLPILRNRAISYICFPVPAA